MYLYITIFILYHNKMFFYAYRFAYMHIEYIPRKNIEYILYIENIYVF